MSYVGMSQLVTALMGILTVAILARMLDPSELGVAFLGLLVVPLLVYVADFGTSTAIVQSEGDTEAMISTALAIRCLITLPLMACAIVARAPISFMLGDNALEPVIIVLALSLPLQALSFPPFVRLTKTLQFKALSVCSVVQSVVYSVATICLASFGFSYWSLVIGYVVGLLGYAIVLNAFSFVRFRIAWSYPLARDIIGYGSHVFLSSLLLFLVASIDQFVIGAVIGVYALGFYVMGVKFGRTIGEQLSGLVGRVLFPTLSRIKDDATLFAMRYSESMRMVGVFSIPMCVVLSCVSPIMVPVLFGERWADAVIPIMLLSVQGLVSSFVAVSQSALLSRGMPSTVAKITFIQFAVICGGLYPAAYYGGVSAVSLLMVMSSVSALLLFLYEVSELRIVELRRIWESIRPSVFAGVGTWSAVVLASSGLAHTMMTLLAVSMFASSLYVTLLLLCGGFRDLRDALDLMSSSFLGRR